VGGFGVQAEEERAGQGVGNQRHGTAFSPGRGGRRAVAIIGA
jgi:hypothetical protein